MNKAYDRLAVGDRLRLKRTLLGMTQDEMAEKINRAPKYYADIERGNCGMSVETLLALSESLHMSLDYIFFGDEDETISKVHTDEVAAIIDYLDNCNERTRAYALKMMKLFLVACDNNNDHDNNNDLDNNSK